MMRTSARPLARLAEPLVGAVVQEAEQPRLRVGAEVADLVEEQRAALGLLDLADRVGDRAGERAALVAEERARS